MSFLKKIQNLPEKKRKIILWVVIIVIGTGLLVWWIGSIEERLKIFQASDFKQEFDKIPKIEIPEIPKFEMPAILPLEILKEIEKIKKERPEITEEELQKIIEEILKETREYGQ